MTQKPKTDPKPKLTKETLTRLKPRKLRYKQRFQGARGLTLEVMPNGAKLWRCDVWFKDREVRLSFGAWPDVTIEAATVAAATARDDAKRGVDPRGMRAAPASIADGDSFGAYADAHIRRMSERGKPKAPETIKKRKWLLGYPAENGAEAVPGLARALRDRPIASITPGDVIAVLKPLEAEGKLETARRLKIAMSLVFRRAVNAKTIVFDPAANLGDDTPDAPTVVNLPAITDADGFGDLLYAISRYRGDTRGVVRAALQLLALTALRPGELRLSRWRDIDFEEKIWTIGAERQKKRKEHVIPLSDRAIEILEALKERTFGGRSDFIFPSPRSRTRPISDNACNAALRTMGFDNHVSHGLRSSFKSLASEARVGKGQAKTQRWNPDAIKRQMSHAIGDSTDQAYNRTPYWQERVEMAEWWARKCDQLERRTRLLGPRKRKTRAELLT